MLGITEIILGVLSAFMFIFIMFFFMLYLKQQERSERVQAHLLDLVFHSKFSEKRADMEESVIALGKQFQKSADDFSDVYHLPLRGQRLSENESNNFLLSMGLKRSNVDVRSDFIFVLTPFSDAERETYALIRSVLTDAGFAISRGDENERLDIFPHIVKSMMESQLIIANINGRNPNVMYELGIAHMLDKPVVLVAQFQDDLSKIPFDLRAKNIVFYDDLEELNVRLSKAVLQIMANRDSRILKS